MNALLGLGVIAVILIAVCVWGARRMLRGILDPCEDCFEQRGGRLKFVDEVFVEGELHGRFKCDRCPNKVFYPPLQGIRLGTQDRGGL